MSIYATNVDLDARQHYPACVKWVDVTDTGEVDRWTMIAGDRKYRLDPDKDCDCRCGPIRYQGSHVLPSDDDERAGSFSLCLIPGFIERHDRPPVGDEDDDYPAHPWLRVWVSDGSDQNGQVVLLDRAQAAEVHEFLGGWLERTPGG